MCQEYIHNKAVEVFTDILRLVEVLKNSKRKNDAEFKGPLRFMIRTIYDKDNTLNYLISVVKEHDAPYCLSAWEITADFKDAGEELFYFIKSKMLIDSKTRWVSFPLYIRKPIDCLYIPTEQTDRKDYTFLTQTGLVPHLNSPLIDSGE